MLPRFKIVTLYPDRLIVAHPINRHIAYEEEVHHAVPFLLFLQRQKEEETESYDSDNLDINEFAHTMFIESTVWNCELHFFKARQSNRGPLQAHQTLMGMCEGLLNICRNYAAINIKELFTVAAEPFIEQPVACREHLPKLYDIMPELLQQDPASKISQPL